VLCGIYGTSTECAITLISLSVGLSGFTNAGSVINHLDIASQYYASILVGIVNTIATIAGFAGPHVIKFIVKKVEHDHYQIL